MSIKQIKASFISKGKNYAIIVSRFNEFITSKLLDGALDALLRHGVKENEVEVFWTPGSFETPQLADQLARSKKYDAIVCLGAIIKGATPHFQLVSEAASRNISEVALATGVPLIFGIITCENIEQAIERSGTKLGNKGWDAALAAIEMANLYEECTEVQEKIERLA
ncbi:MAG: 6,7-dimethyl-8-ribityllumazine synthase [Chlamydiae bacterium]|nr:6,7-dimethyl-8-ribityllumazine synthase [Chlamydiota bacterium]MBI3267151.1 6,7-dimethyl-8-ribityllumazine synthase [Chlamydiota bacterium]